MYPEVVVLTEEPSMQSVVRTIWDGLPDREGIELRIIPHQGAKDLERSLPRKLKGWQNTQARFLVLRDNDNADCAARKQRLLDLVTGYPAAARCKVRIVCQELEAWFLGDLEAVRASGLTKPNFKAKQTATPYRVPDDIHDPVAKLDRCLSSSIAVHEQKLTVANAIAPHLALDRNVSESFKQTVSALADFITELTS